MKTYKNLHKPSNKTICIQLLTKTLERIATSRHHDNTMSRHCDKIPTKTLERHLLNSGYRYVVGVDEVGMGSLAGPVVVCAIGFTNHFYNRVHKKFRRLRDSKLLQTSQREKFAKELIQEKDLVYAITQCSPKVIDKLNIYNASRLAMKRAVSKIQNDDSKFKNDLSVNLKTIVLVDGKTKINGLNNIEQIPIIKGDRKIFAIACASIIAKVYRDKLMCNYAKRYPGYGFEKHKGYGTKYHQAQLAYFGPCAIHRKSFRLKYP